MRLTYEEAQIVATEVENEEGAQDLLKRYFDTINYVAKVKIMESIAVRLYTDMTYKKVNPLLRIGAPPLGFEFYYRALCSALSRLPHYKGRVYRAVELTRDAQSHYENNSEVFEQAFMSTSADKAARRNFQNNTNKNYNTYFYINSKTGRDISEMSLWNEEREVLFPAQTRFKVTNTFRPYFSDTLYVWLDEI